MNGINRLFIGDCNVILPTLDTKSVQTVVTSPPYFNLRDYGVDGQIGQESTVEEYVAHMVAVFREVRRVLKDDGTVWLNLGDSYAGSGQGGNPQKVPKIKMMRQLKPTPRSGLKRKNLIGVPWRVAFALQQDGWYLRQDIIWHKPNVMPESVKDRCVRSHEYVFLLSKSSRYYFDYKAIQEDSVTFENRLPAVVRNRKYGYASKLNAANPQYNLRRNDKRDPLKQAYPQKRLNRKDCNYDITKRSKRDVWTVHTRPYKGAHFAAFPLALVIPCILAGSKEGDTVLDPFFGSGTTAEGAALLGRSWLGIELNPEYAPLYKERLALFA